MSPAAAAPGPSFLAPGYLTPPQSFGVELPRTAPQLPAGDWQTASRFGALPLTTVQTSSAMHAQAQAALGAHASCHPVCTWSCTTQPCEEVCEPVCSAPKCETRCPPVSMEGCFETCDDPDCTVICPPSTCPQSCPQCRAVCNSPSCKVTCPPPLCESVCAEPKCDWNCHKPEHCPAPDCHLTCEPAMPCANQVPTSDMIPAPTSTQILRVSASRAHLGAGIGSPQAAAILPADTAPAASENASVVFEEAAEPPELLTPEVIDPNGGVEDENATSAQEVALAPEPPQIVATQDASTTAGPVTVVHDEGVVAASAGVNAAVQMDSPNVQALGSVVAQLPAMSMPGEAALAQLPAMSVPAGEAVRL